ncbi:SDR family NAD(P)-dependent oxidoreductase [Halomarina halobia]|uniref:SDR family NAD(P)-dependent oxidoreductase n=1 Tax=Halomarina halobia TaxID=3033386 RepID=A0ABD6AFQ7_9EURY|nr:SDR family NAD(P)-dependent oxidoreductase [Halomarina sp. PSR21]
MSDLLVDTVATVTGGSSGIGRSTPLEFAAHGASVVVVDVQATPQEDGTPTDDLIRERGGEATYVKCDVTSTDDIRIAVDEVERSRESTSWSTSSVSVPPCHCSS